MKLSLFLALGLALSLARPAPAAYHATVDPSVRYQTVEGWGTSLAWWANVVGGFPEPARGEYIARFFDPAQGLGLNVVRYNIGGGENPAHLAPNPQFLSFRAAVPGFEPSPGRWDWSADANQRWVLRAAIAHGVNHVEAFSNSPPWWMTVSGSVTGNQEGGRDNLDPAHNGDFAEYLATVARHFRDAWGVTFDTVEPLNESVSNFWHYGGSQEGCHFDRPSQNAIITALGASLARRGVAGRVSASDENSIDDAVRTFDAYSPAALKALVRINTHSYGGTARAELKDRANAAHKGLWMSEYGDGDASGLIMSRRILEDMRDLRPTAWVYWQTVDNAGGWGFVRNPLRDETTTAYTVNEKYYVMGQYSRFIRPGYQVISVDDQNSLAAYDARTKTLVIVTTNSTDSDLAVTYDLSRFRRLGARVAAYRTSPSEQWAKQTLLPVTRGGFTATAKARSVTTYVLTGAA